MPSEWVEHATAHLVNAHHNDGLNGLREGHDLPLHDPNITQCSACVRFYNRIKIALAADGIDELIQTDSRMGK